VHLIFAEFSLEESSTCEFADTSSTSNPVSEVSSVNVAVLESNHPLAMPVVLLNGAYILFDVKLPNRGKFFHHVINKGLVLSIDSVLQRFWNMEAKINFERRSSEVALIESQFSIRHVVLSWSKVTRKSKPRARSRSKRRVA